MNLYWNRACTFEILTWEKSLFHNYSHANNVVKFNVVHGKFIRPNSITYARPMQRWQVHNKAPLDLSWGLPQSCLFVTELMERGLQPYIEPPCWPGNHQWPWNCEMQTVYFSWQPRVWEQVEPQTETMLEAFKDISNCLLIRVPSQV